jgi:hypothetical protein
LLTIASPGYPACITATEPCVDPVFGPTIAFYYWSVTTFAAYLGDAWSVAFATGSVHIAGTTAANYVRAVRSGSRSVLRSQGLLQHDHVEAIWTAVQQYSRRPPFI